MTWCQVEGLGTRDSGEYQVSAVTHMINAADHHLEVQFRRNSVGKAYFMRFVVTAYTIPAQVGHRPRFRG